MQNRDIAQVVTASLAALWDQETERQTRHEWVGGPDNKPWQCIKCGLPIADSIHTGPVPEIFDGTKDALALLSVKRQAN